MHDLTFKNEHRTYVLVLSRESNVQTTENTAWLKIHEL